jgi:hypothetical protein
MASRKADEMLANHPSYYSIDRLGQRWYRGRYQGNIKLYDRPVGLPRDQWSKIIKMRGGFHGQTK